jgi:DNA adenine methylase
MNIIKSPYPYFGNKKKVVQDIWNRLGNVENYIEPFAGSLSVLLGNPNTPKMETTNDLDGFISNFWRAVRTEPEKVAEHADYPVLELDLHTRHKWFLSPEADEFRKKLHDEPEFYDPKIAGWWVWGMNASIGITFTKQRGLKCKPFLSMIGQGVTHPNIDIYEWFKILQNRLKKVRVCCGDWSRIVTPAVTYKNKSLTKSGIVGVFLDPPYLVENREDKLYRVETDVFNDVCKWAVDNATNPKMRIAVCGYEGDFQFPDDWSTFHWTTNGGFSSFAKDEKRGKDNSKKETIWFSPHCLSID